MNSAAATERADRAKVRGWIGRRTQVEAARDLGSTQSVVSAFLAGSRGGEISAATMVRWADVIDCDVDVFIRAKFRATT